MVRGPTAVEEGAMPQTPLSALSPESAALCPITKSPTTLAPAALRCLRGMPHWWYQRGIRPLWTLLSAVSLSLALAAPVSADSIMVPNIGTAGSLGISVPKEIAIGDFFMRTARSKMPLVDDPEENRLYFRRLRNLSVDIGAKKVDNVTMSILSMGMTNDYEVAVEEGATMVRVGTGLFGARNYAQC